MQSDFRLDSGYLSGERSLAHVAVKTVVKNNTVFAAGEHSYFFKPLYLITLAESLGGVESLVCHPASMTHASIPYEVRQKVGITDGLIRLYIGVESVDDLRADLAQAIQEREE